VSSPFSLDRFFRSRDLFRPILSVFFLLSHALRNPFLCPVDFISREPPFRLRPRTSFFRPGFSFSYCFSLQDPGKQNTRVFFPFELGGLGGSCETFRFFPQPSGNVMMFSPPRYRFPVVVVSMFPNGGLFLWQRFFFPLVYRSTCLGIFPPRGGIDSRYFSPLAFW